MKYLIFLIFALVFKSAFAQDCNEFRVKLILSDGSVQFYQEANKAIKDADIGSKIRFGNYNFNEKLKISNKENLNIKSNCLTSFEDMKITYSSNIKVKNLIFDGGNEQNIGINLQGNNEDIVLNNVQVINYHRDGIKISNTSKFIYIRNSLIQDNDGNGIEIQQNNSNKVVVKNTQILNNGLNGVLFSKTNLRVVNSDISNNGQAGNQKKGYGLSRISANNLKSREVKVLNSNFTNNNGKIVNTSPISTIDINNVELIADNKDIGNTTTTNTEFIQTNDLPIARTQDDLKVNLGEEIILDGTNSYNVFNGALTYQWRVIEKPTNASAQIESVNSPLTKLVIDSEGSYKIGLIVSSGNKNSIEDIIIISTQNVRPVAKTNSAITSPVNSNITLSASESFDLDGDNLTYNWIIVSKPNGSNVITQNLETFDINLDIAGDYEFQLVVNDGTQDSKPAFVKISTNNTAPIAVANENLDYTLGNALALNAQASSDFDNNPLTYQWSIIYSPLESMVEIDNDNDALTNFNPDVNGIYIFQLITNDANIDSIPYTFYLNVQNTKPVAQLIETDSFVETQSNLAIDGSLSLDENNENLTYLWSVIQKPTNSSAEINSEDSIINFIPDVSGNYTIQLIVNDGIEDSLPVSISFNSTFRPVAIVNGPTNVKVSDFIQLDGSASNDLDGDQLFYSWSLASKPNDSLSVLGNSGSNISKFIFDKEGVYNFELVVSDGKLNSSAVTLSINATEFVNSPPVINDIPGQTIFLGDTATIQISGNDTDGDFQFKFSPLPLPDGMKFNARTGELIYKPTPEAVGFSNYTVSITDGVESVSKTLVINVVAPPAGTPTSMSGRVLDTTSHTQGQIVPIVGATVSIQDTNSIAVTDANGFFTLTDIPNPEVIFYIDTSTANDAPDGSKYANFGEGLILIEGVNNTNERPFYIPRVDPAGITEYQQNTEVTLANPNLGIEATIPASTVITTPDGNLFEGEISISEVPLAVAPVALPDNLRPSMLLTIQPAGIRFSDPLEISFPNTNGYAPGSITDIHSVNVETGMFEVVGKGQVTPDGTKIVTIEGGVRAATWHFEGPDSTESEPNNTDTNAEPASSSETASSNDDEGGNTEGGEFSCGSIICLVTGGLKESHSIVSYKSLNKDQTTTLYYNSLSAVAKPVIDADLTVRFLSAVPNLIGSSVFIEGIDQGFEVFTATTGFDEEVDETISKKFQIDLSDLPTNMYTGVIRTNSLYNSSTFGNDNEFDVVHLNSKSSPYGIGWGIAELWRAYEQENGKVLFVSGKGVFKVFKLNIDNPSEYVSPTGLFETLTKVDNKFVIETKNRTKFYFDTEGLLVKRMDRNKNSVHYKYDNLNRLISKVDEVGLKTEFIYLGDLLSEIIDPAGRSTFINMEDNKIKSIIDPDGTNREFNYGTNDELVSQKKKNGSFISYSYNDFKQIINTIRGEGANKGILSDKSQGIAQATIPCNGCALLTRKGSRFNPDEPVKAESLFAREFDELNAEKKIRFNNDFNKLEDITALGRTTNMQRDDQQLVTEVVRPTNTKIANNYDDNGNLLKSELDGSTEKVDFQYNQFNEVTQVTDGKGENVIYQRDQKGNILQVTYENGFFIRRTYNNKGQVLSELNKNRELTLYEYNQVTGNLSKVINPDGTWSSFERDAAGNIISSTDENFNTTLTQFDELNRPILMTLADSTQVEMLYTEMGDLRFVKDARDNVTIFEYDLERNMTKSIDPEGLTEEYVYNARNELIEKKTKQNQRIFYSYNEDQQLIEENYGSDSIFYNYFDNGNLETISNSILAESYTYNAQTNRRESVSITDNYMSGNYNFAYIYNQNGLMTQMDDNTNSFTINYGYGDQDTLSTVQYNSKEISMEYDNEYKRVAINFPSGVKTNYSYDNRDRLKNIRHGDENSIIQSIAYNFDKVGNISQRIFENNLPISKNQFFAYDQIYQLEAQTNPFDGSNNTFQWDDLGNKLSENEDSFQAVYDKNNRIIEDKDFNYLHDDNGNLTKRVSKNSGQTNDYTWNNINQLLKIETFDSNNNLQKTIEYVYGPLKRRIAKIIDGNLFEHYIYSGDNVIIAEGVNGFRRYIHSNKVDEALVMIKDGSDYYMHADNLGSVITMSKEDKSIEEQYAYSAFGEMKIYDENGVERPASSLGNIYGYTGREMDEESDLYYYRARYYNPGSGRFLSEDPIGFESGDYNEYRYVLNNVAINKDPSGLQISGFMNGVVAPSLGQSILCLIDEDLCPCLEGNSIDCQSLNNPIIEHTCNPTLQSCPLPTDIIIINDENQDPGSC